MKRSGPIKRHTPVRKRRATPRRGEPTAEEKDTERRRVYARCAGRCELRGEDGKPLHIDHVHGLLPSDGQTPWDHWHLVHLHSKRRFGWTEAQGNTLLGGCPPCHLIGMHVLGLKPKDPRGSNDDL